MGTPRLLERAAHVLICSLEIRESKIVRVLIFLCPQKLISNLKTSGGWLVICGL